MDWEEELDKAVREKDEQGHARKGGYHVLYSAEDLRLLTVKWDNSATYLSHWTKGIVKNNNEDLGRTTPR